MHTRPVKALSPEWFAVQVWAGREGLSARHLRQRGYDVFLPCYLERHRWSDRVKRVERALFPGYVFCRIEAEVVGKIITTPGVLRVVGDGLGPLSIPDHEIDGIRRIVDTRLSVEPWPFLQEGQRVCIEAGPLRGTEGVVLRATGGQRLIVSITMLHRSVAVEIDPDWVTVPYVPWQHEAATS